MPKARTWGFGSPAGIIPDVAMAALGRVVATWAHVEFQFDLLFLRKVVKPVQANFPASDLSMMKKPFNERVRLLRKELAAGVTEGETKRQKIFFDDLLMMQRERNKLGHSPVSLIFNGEPGAATLTIEKNAVSGMVYSWQQFADTEFQRFEVDELDRLRRRMEVAHSDLVCLHLGQAMDGGPMTPAHRKAWIEDLDGPP